MIESIIAAVRCDSELMNVIAAVILCIVDCPAGVMSRYHNDLNKPPGILLFIYDHAFLKLPSMQNEAVEL